MDDALLMGRFEGFGNLLGDGEGFVDGDRALLDAVRQGWPFDEFEHQRPDALSLLQPVDAPDVGVVQRGEDLGFPLEAGQPVGVGRERLRQHLQRHVSVKLRVAGLSDFTHPAFADLGGHVVVPEAGAGREGHGCQGRTSESYRRQDDAWGRARTPARAHGGSVTRPTPTLVGTRLERLLPDDPGRAE